MRAHSQIRDGRSRKGGRKKSKESEREGQKKKRRTFKCLNGGEGYGGDIGGANLPALVLWWHQRRNAIDQLTLKVVLVGAEGQGKKS